MLDNPVQVDGLLSVMKDGLQSLTPKQYGYEVCTRAYDRLSAYKDGSYSLIQRAADMPQKAAPAKQPKASREQKPLDAAQSALRRLKSQSRKTAKADEPEQLSFDFRKVRCRRNRKNRMLHPPVRKSFYRHRNCWINKGLWFLKNI